MSSSRFRALEPKYLNRLESPCTSSIRKRTIMGLEPRRPLTGQDRSCVQFTATVYKRRLYPRLPRIDPAPPHPCPIVWHPPPSGSVRLPWRRLGRGSHLAMANIRYLPRPLIPLALTTDLRHAALPLRREPGGDAPQEVCREVRGVHGHGLFHPVHRHLLPLVRRFSSIVTLDGPGSHLCCRHRPGGLKNP